MTRYESEHIWGVTELRNQAGFNYSENPWDGSDIMKNSAKARKLDIKQPLRIALIFATFLSLFILLFAGNIEAGKVTEKETDKNSNTNSNTRKRTITHSHDSKAPRDRDVAEIAEEYAYLLEQLLYLSSDYCRYFIKLDDVSGDENYKALANMCSRISQKEQYEDVGKVVGAIAGLKKELADRELQLARVQTELKSQSSELRRAQSNLKALKLTRSLREELESLDEQIERDVIWRIEKNSYSNEAIQQYVTAIVNDSLIQFISSMADSYAPVVRVQANSNGNTTAVVLEVAPTPEVNAVYIPVPTSPNYTPRSHPTPESPVLLRFSGDSYSREFNDSLKIESVDIDISITNVIGDVIVSSSANNYVTTNYIVRVVSDESEKSELFGEEIHLRMYPKANKVYIETVVPSLRDPATRIAESKLEVFVPDENNISISNSSGNVSVSDLSNDIRVKSTSCNVEIYRLNGNVALVNSSGTVSVGKVDGKVNVQNRMGPITLFKCDGAIEIDNSFGQISMDDCQGDAVVRNTGPVIVENHTGAVEITNRNGTISVENIEGNLAVFNSFESISVANVSGAAKIINANASITLEQISGQTTANNRFGKIIGIGLAGPIMIENKNGDIMLELTRPLHGESKVISNGGNVIVSVSNMNDLLINLVSIGGDIEIAGFESQIDRDKSGIMTASLSLGKGLNSLGVKTTGSSISLERIQ